MHWLAWHLGIGRAGHWGWSETPGTMGVWTAIAAPPAPRPTLKPAHADDSRRAHPRHHRHN